MSERPRVLVVVAASGLGHLRRVLAVLGALVAQVDVVPDLTIAAPAGGRARFADWGPCRAVEATNATWVDGVTDDGVAWAADPAALAGDRLTGWEARLGPLLDAARPDLVVSDNLVGVLAHRPDAVLMGSFLWSDVLAPAAAHQPDVAAFVARDRALLAEHRPPMLGVGDMAMPGVVERTAFVPVGWMCEPMAPATPGATRVAVLGGRTGGATDVLAAAALTLAGAGHEVVADADLLDPGLLVPGRGPAIDAFDYSPGAWASLGAVVARPGMGTLTECVGRGLPIVSLHEPGHPELDHNGARVEALGLGFDLGAHVAGSRADPGGVADCLARVLADRGGSFHASLRSRDRTGVDAAAAWLAERLGLTITSPSGAAAPR